MQAHFTKKRSSRLTPLCLRRFLFCGLLWLILTEAIHARVVFTDSFETPLVSQSPFNQTLNEGDAAGRFEVNFGPFTLENSTARGRNAFDQDQVLLFGLVGDGRYESEIKTVLTNLQHGQLYKIEFYYSCVAFARHYGTANLVVKLDFEPMDRFSITVPDQGQGFVGFGTVANPWTEGSVLFTATAAEHTLGFTGFTFPIGPYAALDMVQVSAVPEPATWVLAGLSLAWLAGRNWTRRLTKFSI